MFWFTHGFGGLIKAIQLRVGPLQGIWKAKLQQYTNIGRLFLFDGFRNMFRFPAIRIFIWEVVILWHSGSSLFPSGASENSIWHWISISSQSFHVCVAWNRHSSAVGCYDLGCSGGCGCDGPAAATFGDWNSSDATDESFAHVLAARPKVRHQLRQCSISYAEHVPRFGEEFEFLDESLLKLFLLYSFILYFDV